MFILIGGMSQYGGVAFPLILKGIKNVDFQNYEVCPTYDFFYQYRCHRKVDRY